MKKQINKLVKIAEEYVKTAKKLNFDINQHNYIRSHFKKRSDLYRADYNRIDSFKPEVKLYFGGDWSQYSLDYGNELYVIGYKNSIELPLDITAEKLNEIIEDLENLLPKLKRQESKAIEIKEARKKAEIESLEAKLKELQS